MSSLVQRLVPVRPPLLALAGVAIALAGLILDAAIHLLAGDHHHGGFQPPEHAAHLVGLIGMVVALAGIVIDGARGGRRDSRN